MKTRFATHDPASRQDARRTRPPLRRARSRFLGRFIACIATLWVLSPAAALAQDAGTEGHPAYINTTAINLRSAPGTGEVLGILVKYDPVMVFDQREIGGQTWYSVEAPGGYTNGWVAGRSKSCKPSPVCIQFGEPPASTVQAEVDYGKEQTPTLIRGVAKYVGARVCAECHEDATGEFHTGASVIWQRRYHAQAYDTLTREYTREIAKRVRGIDDPANDWRCLKCHVTALGADASDKARTYRHGDGVGCEVCHGPGGRYAKEDHGPGVRGREAMGFRLLRDLAERREVCTACHNSGSPTFIGFDLRGFSQGIAHWNPRPNDFFYQEATAEVARRDEAVAREEKQKPEVKVEREKKEKEVRQQATVALEQQKQAEVQQKQKVQKAALQAKADVAGDPLAEFLEDVDDVITMNVSGRKYDRVEFSHLAHAGNRYLPGGSCSTCHHTQEGNDMPEACSDCHDIDGDADEVDPKKRAYHSRSLPYPKQPGQDEVSCMGCHKSIRSAIAAGSRQGDPPPVKCTACHAKKS